MNANIAGFRWFSKIFAYLCTKLPSAFEGLILLVILFYLILLGLVRCVLHIAFGIQKSYIKVTSWGVINCYAI